MIYTSNYFNIKDFKGTKIQISNSRPKGHRVDFKYDILVPDWYLVDNFKKGIITYDTFKETYLKQLDKLDKKDILQWLNSVDKDIVLLCWCRNKQCHRYVLAEWLGNISEL
jgi:uncharacterized protein YeaO (DUF488 family)